MKNGWSKLTVRFLFVGHYYFKKLMSINAKKKKKDQLGMDNSTASHKLRKLILFSLVQQTAQDFCFRCQTKIETVEELSIEHKTPWLDSENPVITFLI